MYIEKVCKNCGNEFIRKSNAQQYCSVECSNEACRKNRKEKEKKRIDNRIKRAKYDVRYGTWDDPEICLSCNYDECNGSCERVEEDARERLVGFIISGNKVKCETCGKKFHARRGQKYCSRECSLKSYSQKKSVKNEKTSHELDIIAGKANATGMTYGKYIAVEYKKSMQKYARTFANKTEKNEL